MVKFEVENTNRIGGWIHHPRTLEGEFISDEAMWEIIDYLVDNVEKYDRYTQEFHNRECIIKHFGFDDKWEVEMHYSESDDLTTVYKMGRPHRHNPRKIHDFILSVTVPKHPEIESYIALKYGNYDPS